MTEPQRNRVPRFLPFEITLAKLRIAGSGSALRSRFS